jgi:pectate lyase
MIVLEFVTSKIAMMVAATIILVSVLGIFSMQREDAKDLELRNIADEISGTINEVNAISGETRINMSYEKSIDGIYLDPEVDGKEYEIIITRNEVIVRQKDRMFLRSFIESIHVWKPDSEFYDSIEITQKDNKNAKMELRSGEDFQIFRRLIESEKGKEYMTFIYT